MFTIKDLEKLSGIKAHTIRAWEERYSFLKPKRTETNIRYYSKNELKRLLDIALLNRNGYRVSSIDKMNADDIDKALLNLDDAAITDREVDELVKCMVDLDLDNFENKMRSDLILPFLERTGLYYNSGGVRSAGEQMVLGIVRKKLVVAGENNSTHRKSSTTAVLFMPEGDHYEIGLLVVQYLLKRQGIRTIYLGTNVPMADVGYVIEQKAPDHLFLHITGEAPNFNLQKYLQRLEKISRNTTVVLTGEPIRHYYKRTPENFHLKGSVSQLKKFIEGM